MAPRVKKEKEPEPGEGGSGVAAFRGNGFDPAIAGPFVSRVENLNSDIGKLKSAFLLECKAIHADIKEVMTEAKNAGIPKKSLRNVVKKRKLERDIEGIREDLDGEDQDNYDQLVIAMDRYIETPLGAAAIQAAA